MAAPGVGIAGTAAVETFVAAGARAEVRLVKAVDEFVEFLGRRFGTVSVGTVGKAGGAVFVDAWATLTALLWAKAVGDSTRQADISRNKIVFTNLIIFSGFWPGWTATS